MHNIIDPSVLDLVLTVAGMLVIAAVLTALVVSFDPHVDKE